MNLPFLISIPHCSSRIPGDIMPGLALSEEEILESTDIGTLELFGEVPARAMVYAEWSRLVVDLNRGAHETGPKGLIAKVDYNGRRIYLQGCEPDRSEIDRRLRKQYRPYHDKLEKQVSRQDILALFDCHSLGSVGPAEAPDPGMFRKDIILGNNGLRDIGESAGVEEKTCPWETLYRIKEAFEETGFSVALNDPYSGGFITKYYGKLLRQKGKIAVQIEINERLYTDTRGLRVMPEKVEKVRDGILESFERIAGLLQ